MIQLKALPGTPLYIKTTMIIMLIMMTTTIIIIIIITITKLSNLIGSQLP